MSSLFLETKQKIKKRKYSRNGCKECKRRKIKCDETLPECNNCSRLNKRCVYEQTTAVGPGDSHTDKIGAIDSDKKPKIELQMRYYSQSPPKLAVELPPTQQRQYIDAFAASAERMHGRSQTYGNGIVLATNNATGLHSSSSMEPQHGERPQVGEIGMLAPPPAATLNLPSPSQIGMSPGTLTNMDMQMLFDEASVLVHDMNHLVGEDLLESFVLLPNMVNVPGDGASKSSVGTNASPLSNTSDDRSQFRIDDFSASIHEDAYVSPSGIQEHLLLSNLELIDQCIAENSLEEPHITYLRTVTTTDILYHLYPFASLIELNEVVKLLLTYSGKCPYLLTSLLAISATFQFNQTGKAANDRARRKYITVCFQSLSDAFTEHSGFKNTAIFSSNIEKLLLTVLVLTSYFTATTCMLNNSILNSWKAHLRGARDLLMNYSKVTSSYPTHFISGGLALAKCWFFAIESSAAFHSPIGGSLLTAKNDSDSTIIRKSIYSSKPGTSGGEDAIFAETGVFERSVHPEYHDALYRVNMVSTSPFLSDFNLFYGYTSKFVNVVLQVCSVIDTMRVNSLQTCPHRWLTHLVKLNDEASADHIVPEVLVETFMVPSTSIGHPEYSGNDKVVFPRATWVSDVDESGNKVYYSWFDASQQLHVDYLYLWILVSPGFMRMSRTHTYVQELIAKLFAGAFFIKSKSLSRYLVEKSTIIVESDNFYLSLTTFDMRCVMVQSIFRILSGLVIDDKDFEKIELFFMGLVKLGNGSSLNSLDIVARFKENRRKRREQFPGEVDTEIYEYYERSIDIPFA